MKYKIHFYIIIFTIKTYIYYILRRKILFSFLLKFDETTSIYVISNLGINETHEIYIFIKKYLYIIKFIITTFIDCILRE